MIFSRCSFPLLLPALVFIGLQPSIAAPVATGPKLPAIKRKPGYVVGRAVFGNGRPIPKFTVSVAGFDGGGVNLNGGVPTVGYTEAQGGKYAVRIMDSFSRKKPVTALVVNVSANAKISYRGKSYAMALHPLDGKASWRDAKGNAPSSAKGLTRDFVLKIAGVKPGQDTSSDYLRRFAYYGATLNLNDWVETRVRDAFPATAQLKVILTPQGTLLDGTTGKALVRQMSLSALGTEAGRVLDIPIGVYSVQAQVASGGVATPLALRVTWGDPAWKSVVTVNFPPSTSVSGADSQILEMKP